MGIPPPKEEQLLFKTANTTKSWLSLTKGNWWTCQIITANHIHHVQTRPNDGQVVGFVCVLLNPKKRVYFFQAWFEATERVK